MILFENNNFIIINKPPGISFQGENGILSKLRNEFHELYGVHRLDKDTSGLMIFAKSKEIEKDLKLLFATKKVQKTYLGLTRLKPKKKMGIVKGDIIKARGGNYRLARTHENPSYTKFLSYYDDNKNLRIYVFSPKTGKTHQLRVVAASLGAPLLGDMRYGKCESDRMYLHAFKLEFKLKGEAFCFKAFPASGEEFNEIQVFLESRLIDWAYL